MAGGETVRVERDGPVTVVTIDRPERRNAVDAPTAAALADAFRGFDRDQRASVAVLTGAGDLMALKPMNCPAHVQIFRQGVKSYRDLPIRMAEFGCCHRNEAHGALHGLLREMHAEYGLMYRSGAGSAAAAATTIV